VLGDHSKWGVAGLCAIAPLGAAAAVVTDDGLDDAARAVLREQVGRLVVAATDLDRSA
jgi:DeoR/GlpR family transcriptional regulator of sugar metabolism